MLDVELICKFRQRPLSFEDGVAAFHGLLLELQTLTAFQTGWEINGKLITGSPEVLRDEMKGLLEPDAAAGGYFFAGAESARVYDGREMPIEQYVAFLRFNQNRGNQELRLTVVPSLCDADMLLDVTKVLAAWWPLQHVQAGYRHYASRDSPLDQINRAGLGWAGWIPFRVTADAVPEAQIVHPLGSGTFLATQTAFWDLTDPAAVKHAQDLELRLNSMGMLPTRDVLRDGTWGQ